MIWLFAFLFYCHFSLQALQSLSIDNKLQHILPVLGKENVPYRLAEVEIPEKHMRTETLNLTLPLWDRNVKLLLQSDSFLIHDGFEFLARNENLSRTILNDALEPSRCLYSSRRSKVKASIDLCDGLNGLIVIQGVSYIVRSLPMKYRKAERNAIPYLIVKINSAANTENEEKPMKIGRRERSVNFKKEVKIETAVFVDQDFYKHMMNNFPENTERSLYRFVLALINAVQLLFHDDSLETKVSFALKRLEILHSDPSDLQRFHDIDRYLNNFCTWQEKEKVSFKKSSLYWDHALMLTGLDLYAVAKNGKFTNQVLGLAPVAGMCSPSSSCTLNEGLHFESVYVVAHEIGHNLGMKHDGQSAENDCDPNSYIMSPTLGSGKNSWSACSNRYLKEFLESSQAQCLFETSHFELDHSEGGVLPGERFDSNLQCILKYGKQSEHAPTQNLEEICRDLRCTKERFTWTTHPALEGTKCGDGKWCRFGRCVNRYDTTTRSKIIDGGWSEWSQYSECASSCLLGSSRTQIGSTGISVATRTCDNPRPENNGRYCSGNNKSYKTCEAPQCSNVPPVTITEFAEQICRRAREVDKDLNGLGFQRNSSDAEEVCTVWCNQYNGGAKSRGWIFPDGTPCHSNRYTSNPMFCISGKCEEFRCFPTNQSEGSTFIANGEHCQDKITHLKISETGWTSVGPCRYSCVTPAMGLRVLKRGNEHNIQLCQSTHCNNKKTLLEFATSICRKYSERVKKLSGFGIQLSATLDDPDRSCHVACQDYKFSHRFYLVTGEEGWFPFGSDCTRGRSARKAYCVSGKCLEFGKNNLPLYQSEYTFLNVRRKRSFNAQNKTVTVTVDLVAVNKAIEILNKGDSTGCEPKSITIDFNNPIHVDPDSGFENGTEML